MKEGKKAVKVIKKLFNKKSKDQKTKKVSTPDEIVEQVDKKLITEDGRELLM